MTAAGLRGDVGGEWHPGGRMQLAALPPADQVATLVPGPDSMTWRYAGDVRVLVAAGYALVLQVAHPTVAAGVREHSDYASDPWGRLLRTLDYTHLTVYGGPEAAAATGGRLRETHERIRGTTPEGRSYRALEPEAFAWVHATLVEAIVCGHRHFGRSLDDREVERLYAEWRALGRLIGIREQDLPDRWSGFRGYFETMVERRLEDSDVVHGVLSSLARPAAPAVPLLTEWAWGVGRIPLARLFSLATLGLLPPTLRERCGLRWTRTQQLQLSVLGASARSMTPIMPAPLRNLGPPSLRWRHAALAGS
jgi:uncharacterized protein (DUF2236 family)